MALSAAELALVEERRSRRSEVCLPTLVKLGFGPKIDAMAVNISAHGVMLEAAGRFVPGRRVTVEIAGLEAKPGRIAWVREGHMGVAFTQPLELEEMLAIV